MFDISTSVSVEDQIKVYFRLSMVMNYLLKLKLLTHLEIHDVCLYDNYYLIRSTAFAFLYLLIKISLFAN